MRLMTFSVISLAAVLVSSFPLLGCESHGPSTAVTPKYSTADIAALLSSAEKGDKNAQFALAVKYHLGDGVDNDPAKAAGWYTKAADAGHLGAMNNLAGLYYDGKGVEQNFSKAIALYKKIADSGDIGGTASIAGMYLDGKGVPQDYNEARRLYIIAAQRGYGPAQNAIGMMYKFGWGVPQDNVEAYAWWILAAANGDMVATDNMKQLSSRLSSSDIERAQERSKQLGTSIPKH